MAKRDDPQYRYVSDAFKGRDVDDGLKDMLGSPTPDVQISVSRTAQSAQVVGHCDGCGRAVHADTAFSFQGKTWHQTCFNKDRPCARCNKPIFGEVVCACDKFWHPTCFTCFRCEAKLNTSGVFVEKRGEPYCKPCSTVDPVIHKTATPTGMSAEERERLDRQRQEEEDEIFRNIQEGKAVCVGCKKVLAAGGAVSFKSQAFHIACLQCASCKGSLEAGFVEKQGKPLCAKCGASGSSGASSVCSGCSHPIAGKCLGTASGAKYHPHCFVCSSCGKANLAEGYIEKQGKPVCRACGTTATTTTSQKLPGFTVNPQTGEKKYRS